MQTDKTHLTRKGEFFAEVFYSDFLRIIKVQWSCGRIRRLDLEKLKKENKEVNFVSKSLFLFLSICMVCSAHLTRYPKWKIGFLAGIFLFLCDMEFLCTWNYFNFYND